MSDLITQVALLLFARRSRTIICLLENSFSVDQTNLKRFSSCFVRGCDMKCQLQFVISLRKSFYSPSNLTNKVDWTNM